MKIDLTALFKTTNKIYLPLYKNKNRYLVLYGGAGSGKSRFVGQKILLRVLTEEKHRFLIVRKVATTLNKSVWTLMLDYIYKYGLSSIFKINKSDKVITNKINGSQIYFLGLDDREKLKSIEGITSIWVEEASELDKEDFTQLDLRLRGKIKSYKQFILTFNPISINHWLKKHFFNRETKDTFIYKTTYKDNNFLDEKYIEVLEELKETNLNYYKIYALGEWGELKGKIYNNYIEIESYPEKNLNDEAYGVDFGTANPSAVIRVGINYDKRALYIDEIVYEAGLTREELAQKTKDVAPSLLKLVGYGDSAEPHAIKTFRRYGFSMLEGKKDLRAGIDFINSYKVYITKRSYNVKKEWDSYRWKTNKNGEIIDEPIKLNDHSLDAIRYCAFTRWSVTSTGATTSIKKDIKRNYNLTRSKKFDNF